MGKLDKLTRRENSHARKIARNAKMYEPDIREAKSLLADLAKRLLAQIPDYGAIRRDALFAFRDYSYLQGTCPAGKLVVERFLGIARTAQAVIGFSL